MKFGPELTEVQEVLKFATTLSIPLPDTGKIHMQCVKPLFPQLISNTALQFLTLANQMERFLKPLVFWVFFIYPFGEELIESVCEGQAKLGR